MQENKLGSSRKNIITTIIIFATKNTFETKVKMAN
jgi:hypothetical protein